MQDRSNENTTNNTRMRDKMSRTKKPENETEEQLHMRKILEAVANHATRPEKTAWQRKRDNMEELVKRLQPLEEKLIDLHFKMLPIKDEVAELRLEMVEECVHPYDLLIFKTDDDGEYVDCKFCNKKLRPV